MMVTARNDTAAWADGAHNGNTHIHTIHIKTNAHGVGRQLAIRPDTHTHNWKQHAKELHILTLAGKPPAISHNSGPLDKYRPASTLAL